jgi:hypothetical protein
LLVEWQATDDLICPHGREYVAGSLKSQQYPNGSGRDLGFNVETFALK